jgi:autotransporter-associated beta strand protein
MKRTLKCSAAGLAAIALAASSVKAQTLVYSFETLYDNTTPPTQDPAGAFPDDFAPNTQDSGDTTVTRSTIGVTNGSYSMDFTQLASATFTGALTQLVNTTVPGDIDSGLVLSSNTTALSLDVTIPSTGNFVGNFARMGFSAFGNDSFGDNGLQVQTNAASEVNIDLAPGTYEFTIPLIAISNPETGDSNVPFSSVFGSSDTQISTPTGFEFYINKSTQSGLTIYLDNVQAVGPATTGTWASSGGGSWSALGNWTGGVVPGGLDTANFTSAITGTATVTLDGSRSVAALNFDNTNQYIITQGMGAGTLALDAGGTGTTSTVTDAGGTHTIAAPVDFSTNTLVTVNNAGDTLNFSGNINGGGSLTVAGHGTVDLSGANSYQGGTTVSSGVLVIGSATALSTFNAVVNISAGATMRLATGIGSATLQTANIASGGILDITNNKLFIDYGTGADPIASIAAWIKNGFYDLAGPQIISSSIAAADAASGLSYGIGYADSADSGNPANLPTDTIEIMFTLLGDANLDGTVNTEDFTPFSNHLGQSGQMWDDGDFNYDGTVNTEDFTLFSHDLGETASLAAAGTLEAANGISLANVPEPASAGIMVVAGSAILRRRRRSSPCPRSCY